MRDLMAAVRTAFHRSDSRSYRVLESAIYASEELEETAKLFLMLRGNKLRILGSEEIAELQAKWPS